MKICEKLKIENLLAKAAPAAAAALLVFVLFSGPNRSNAQQKPQFLITWSAESYVPPLFAGKILPTANSPITVSFEIIDGGKPVNLSKQTIYWYVNNGLFGAATNKQKTTFLAPKTAPSIIKVRIEIPNYPSGLLVKTLEVPVVRPEAIIEAPYPEKKFAERKILSKGVPYFFGIQPKPEFDFSWRANGAEGNRAEPYNEFVVDLTPYSPPGYKVNISLLVKNLKSELESASQVLFFTFSPQ